MTAPNPPHWQDLADLLTPMQKNFLSKLEADLADDGLNDDRTRHHAYRVATYFVAREDERHVRGK